MINARFAPIEQWVGERTKNRKRSTFGVKYQRTHEQKHDASWALQHLAVLAGVEVQAIRGNATAIDLAYRVAARKTHPDSGGNVEAFQMLQEAVNLLRSPHDHPPHADAAACLANETKRLRDKIKATKARRKYEQAGAVGGRAWTHCADPWNDLKQPMKAYLCQSVRDKLRELDELDYQRRRRA